MLEPGEVSPPWGKRLSVDALGYSSFLLLDSPKATGRKQQEENGEWVCIRRQEALTKPIGKSTLGRGK